jgi:hypothetical protein
MPENKLLNRLEAYLGLDAKRRRKKAGELKEVIKKLKKKEKKLIAESQDAGKGEKSKTLDKRIAILHAQRKKGLKALKKIKQE